MIVRTHKIEFSRKRIPTPRELKIGYESDNLVERLEFRLPQIAAQQTATMMIDGEYADMIPLELDDDGFYGVNLTAEHIGRCGRHKAYVAISGEGKMWNSSTFFLNVGELPRMDEAIEKRYPTAVEQMRQEMAAWSPMNVEIGVQYAGMLLYVGADGRIAPLKVGSGLCIKDGALVLAGATDEEKVSFEADGEGNVRLSGAAFVAQADGGVLLDGAQFIAQADGSVLLA